MSEQAAVTADASEQIPNLFLPDDDEAPVAPVAEEAPPPAAAAPSEETPKPAETPVATEEQQRVAARIEAAKKIELRQARERQEMRREKQELEELRSKYEKIKSNPIEALNELKLDPDEFLKRVISDGKPSPESELADIKAAIKAQAEENARLKAEREQYVQGQAIEKAKDAFLSMVESRHGDFDAILTEYTPEEIREHAFAIAQHEGQAYKDEYGEDIPDEFIAKRLNEFAKARSEKRTAWSQRVKGSLAAASQAPVESAKSSPPVIRANAPRTLTNGQASQKQSAPIGRRTQEEVDAESIRILEKMLRGESK